MTDAPRPRLKADDLAALALEPGDLVRLALTAETASRSRTRLHPPRQTKGRIHD